MCIHLNLMIFTKIIRGFISTTPYTDAQYQKLVAVTQTLVGLYPAIADNITGHSDIAPERKTDPGPAFDWSRFHAMLTTSSDKEIT
ncbi:hypothetical protein FJMB80149_06880 [Enterobacter hormaechei]|nr:hypothetical protein FJMB80149_06880 [Enterobacter hormaechei]